MPRRFGVWMVLAALPALAQSGTVRGKVVDSRSAEPLGLIQVAIDGTELRAETGDDGTFQIAGVPAGAQVLHVAAVGYHLLRQEFTLAAGEEKNFDVLLTPSTARRRETLEVSAGPFELARAESAAAMTLEGSERKNLASVLADDPLRAVQGLPGVTQDNDFSSEFSVRGAGFDRIGLFFDGVLLHSPFHMVDGQADSGSLTIFNGDMLDEMTLFQGAWPVRYADRTAGILAVTTREGDRSQVHARVSASASNAGVLGEGPLGKRGSWLASYRKSYLQYILNRIDFGTDEPPLAFGFTDGEARLGYDLTAKHHVSLSVLDGYSDTDRRTWRANLGLNAGMTSGYQFSLVTLGSRYTPQPWLLLSNQVAWSRERGGVVNRLDSQLATQGYGEWAWHGDGTWIWSGSNQLEFGGMWRRSREDDFSHRYAYNPDLFRPLDVVRGTARRTGAYAQQSFNLAGGKVRVAGGTRWDHMDASPVDLASPYASLLVQPAKRTRVQMDWGQYAQYPDTSQLFSVFGGPQLLPQRATHAELAVDQSLDDRTRVRVEFYNRQDRDLLARPLTEPRLLATGAVFNPPFWAPYVNSQRGYARGVQVMLQRRSANGFTGWVSYAYGRAQLRDGVLGVAFPSDYEQRHTVNVYASRRLRPTVNVSARFTYGSGFPVPGFYRREGTDYYVAAARNGLRLAAYQRTDVRLNKAFVYRKSKLTLYAEAVNLTNRNNVGFDWPGTYDVVSKRTLPTFYSMFPLLPSAGMSVEF